MSGALPPLAGAATGTDVTTTGAPRRAVEAGDE